MAASQAIVTCDICERGPLQHFCNGCEVRLCKDCVVSHLGSGSLEGHTIVQYKHRDARNIQPKFCLEHPSKVKTLYCKECFAQICVSCFVEHKEHEVTDLKQFVNSQFTEIVKCSEHLDIKLLPKCRQSIEKMQLLLEEANTRYDQERQKIVDAGDDLHRKVNKKVEGLLDEIDKQKKGSLNMLQDMIKNEEAKLEEIDQTIDMCEATKSSLDEVLMFNYDEISLEIAHTAEVVFPQFKTPGNVTVDVGSLKRIIEKRRVLDEPLEEETPEKEEDKKEAIYFEPDAFETRLKAPFGHSQPCKEIKEEGEFQVHVLFIQNHHLKPIPDFLENCKRYKEELKLDKDLQEAEKEYQVLLQKAKRPEYSKKTLLYERNLFNERRCQAPTLYDVLDIVSKRCPYTMWKKAMTEFIGLTPIQTKRCKQVLTANEDQVFILEKEIVKCFEESEKPEEVKYEEEDREEEIFHDAMDGETKEHKSPEVHVMFLEKANLQPIANFLENCQRYKEDFHFGEELGEAVKEYKCLLKKAKETGSPVLKNAPPIQLNAVTPSEKCQAPCLYEVIADVAKRCPNAKWMDAVTEFKTLTTI